ncbi:hypothetical protein [Bradyrhizobium sp. LTSP857]|uniref:hypothetical protein n=1 Tax=Bradyrhizobium sp. LTSP857 TaxID=1619231 RepID=UPI0005D255FD|nr:hypothetical protein [Bradyrhizobium sp. LTSP857]KJC50102.1 hypothetical protein UP06_06875 [Bradyrhizobium sp. LTSP857]
MVARLLMLTLLAIVISAFAMPETPQIRATLAAVLAAALLGVAVLPSSSTLTRFARLLAPFLALAISAPAIWMILQLAPIPFRGLGNPIWTTASSALNELLAERLTVDMCATLQASVQYGAVISLGLVTALVAQERQRAAQLLYTLAAATTLLCARMIWRHTGGLDGFPSTQDAPSLAGGAVPAVLGVLLSAAMVVRTIDKIQRGRLPSGLASNPIIALPFALFSMLICGAALLLEGSSSIAIAAFLGTALLLAVFAIRKWFYRIWSTVGVLATIGVLFLTSVTMLPMKENTDPTIALSMQNHMATERMLLDTNQVGSGAGTYVALLPIHRDIGTIASRERPTAAAAVAIEMGRPFLLGVLIVTVLGICTLFRRSLLRRYDYVYAAVGASAAVSLTILAFIEDGILDFGASLLAAALFGLAFGQSRSSSEITSSGRPRPADGVNSRNSTWLPFRLVTLGSASARVVLGAVAVVVAVQSAWLLTHERYLVGPPTATSGVWFGTMFGSALHSQPRDSGLRERQLAAAAQTSIDGAEAAQREDRLQSDVSNTLADALRHSPLRGDLWLMLAAMSKELRSTKYDVVTLLKISYYTAPNDLDLLPLRLSVAFATDSAINDPDLRELTKRDVKIAVTKRPALRAAIAAAYQSAPVDVRAFADNLVSELDPTYLPNMRRQRP